MYTRRNTYADAPGRWITSDGEYEFTKTGDTWTAYHRAHWNATTRQHETRAIGTGSTLAATFALATRHNVTPVGQWDQPGTRKSDPERSS
jgi:hypothetical protein